MSVVDESSRPTIVAQTGWTTDELSLAIDAAGLASTYDRVFLLPTSTAAARASAGPPQAQPGFNPPPAFTPPPQDDPDDDEVVRQHARFVTWRGTWSHIIDARACASADPLELPSAIWTPAWVMQRLDPERCNGVSGSEPQRRLLLRESLNEWLGKSSPAFPATTLGL